MIRICLFVVSFAVFFVACSSHGSYYYQGSSSYNKNLVSKLYSVQKQWSKTPYKLGGTSPRGADCSGFTQTVFLNNFAVKIPRTTRLQMQSGQTVSRRNLRTGDLLFFRTGRGPSGLHVGIYTRNGKFIHLSTRGGVKEVSLNTRYWGSKYLGARRYLR
nr:NlpC/P60 family protein [Campylobacter avium]